MDSTVSQFLDLYTIPSKEGCEGKFFTKSQLYIGYRAFLSRNEPQKLSSIDYAIFSSLFAIEEKKREMHTKAMGQNKYYKLFKPLPKKKEFKEMKLNVANDKDQLYVKLNELNIYLCCKLCCGYLVEATTITECLHSFCRSCIVKHLFMKLSCPVCNVAVHSTNPFSSLRADIVLQDIVNKVVPGVTSSEFRRQKEFENTFKKNNNSPAVKASNHSIENSQITIMLEWVGKEKATLDAEDLVYKYIRVSCQTTVAHLSQFVLQKLEKVNESLIPLVNCQILSGDIILPPILTVKDILENKLDFISRREIPVLHFDLKPFLSS